MTVKHDVGTLIRRYRAEQKMTQQELASAAGIGISTLRDIEQGRTRWPRRTALVKLAAVLRLDDEQRSKLLSVEPDDVAGTGDGQDGRPRGTRIKVLGSLAAWRDDGPVPLGSPRQRAVLGLLALHHGTGLHRDMIIDMLWGQQPPASAVGEVQGYVSRLRRLLGAGYPAGQARGRTHGQPELLVSTVGACYRLEAAAGQLDLLAFQQFVRSGRDAMGTGNPARACHWYERALSLWRGETLSDVEALRGHPRVVEVAQRRADAVLEYARAAAACSAQPQALPQLRELCARDPFNEQAHAELMLALAACGQQAAALVAFGELRDRLETEFGIAPSPVLTRAHLRVLRQQTATGG
jgi:DNA-binding SARP family transcriptional activator/DNA-binding XRE family transcriptional regulator